MKAYSQDLRQRVLDAVEDGMPRPEVVRQFQVSLATIKRLLKQRHQAGHIQPKAIPGPTFSIPLEQHAALIAQLQAQSDAT
jgi:transposase